MKGIALAATALMAVLMIAVGGRADVAQAAPVTIEVRATGAEENPPVSGPGSAFGRFTFDKDTRQLTYAVTVSGLSEGFITAAHIHRGARGVNGPIVHALSTVPFTQIAGTLTLSEADVRDLEAGNFYLNVHSTVNPGGFARGQLVLPQAAAAPTPATGGARVTPPSTGDGGLAETGGAMSPSLFLALVGAFGIGAGAVAVRRAR